MTIDAPAEVSATEFVRRPGRYKDAAKREPIAVTSHGRPEIYLLSPTEFEHYRQLMRREREAVALADASETLIAAMISAPVDPAFAAFDDEDPDLRPA